MNTPWPSGEKRPSKFIAPVVTLKSYGGQPVDITSQTLLRFSQGEQTVGAVVLVKKGSNLQDVAGNRPAVATRFCTPHQPEDHSVRPCSLGNHTTQSHRTEA